MKKLLLLLLTATYASIYSGEPRNWKENFPLVAPQKQHDSLPKQIPQQQTTKFYFTRDGQGLQKEFEQGNKMALFDALATIIVIPAMSIQTKESVLTITTVTAGLLTYYTIQRLTTALHELGHFMSYKILLPEVAIESFYVSVLPTNGGHIAPDTATKKRLIDNWKENHHGEPKSKLKSYLFKECIVGAAGPLIEIATSVALLYANSYCNNEYLQLVTKYTAIAGLLNGFYNFIPLNGSDGDLIVTRLQVLKGLVEL
ncbi:MAG: hypothetical protein WCE21_03310 [Candidatus Babeliales bacterium]